METNPRQNMEGGGFLQELQPRCYSIWNAIQTCEHAQNKKQKDNMNGPNSSIEQEITYVSSGTIVIDVIAVVCRLSIWKHNSRCAEIWIGDGSLETEDRNGIQVFVSLYGKQTINAIRENTIKVGDIVQFHALSLRRKITKTQPGSSETETFEFQRSSWQNQHQNENDWTFIYHISGAIDSTGDEMTNTDTGLRKIDNHEINMVLIRDLVHWYRTSRYCSSFDISPPLPSYQRRSLEDVIVSVGVISSVMVRVDGIESVATSPNVVSAKKRRRSSSPSNTASFIVATVSDGSHTMVPLILANNTHKQFQTMLHKALQAGQPVMLNNVICRKGRDILGHQHQQHCPWEDDAVLIPTCTTDVVLCSETKSLTKGDQQTQPFLTATQYSQEHHHQQQRASIQCQQDVKDETALVVETTLRAVIIQAGNLEASLTKDCNALGSSSSSEKELVQLLLRESPDDTDVSYHEATLLLDGWDDLNGAGRQQDVVRVYADCCGVQNLCGGLEARELKHQPKLQAHVRDLLQGLLQEKVLLRWRLLPRQVPQAKEDDYHLDKVTLVVKL